MLFYIILVNILIKKQNQTPNVMHKLMAKNLSDYLPQMDGGIFLPLPLLASDTDFLPRPRPWPRPLPRPVVAWGSVSPSWIVFILGPPRDLVLALLVSLGTETFIASALESSQVLSVMPAVGSPLLKSIVFSPSHIVESKFVFKLADDLNSNLLQLDLILLSNRTRKMRSLDKSFTHPLKLSIHLLHLLSRCCHLVVWLYAVSHRCCLVALSLNHITGKYFSESWKLEHDRLQASTDGTSSICFL